MKEGEFVKALRAAQTHIEDALIIMAEMKDAKDRFLLADPRPLADAFRSMEAQLTEDYARG